MTESQATSFLCHLVFACCHISVIVLNAFKVQTSDEVIFEQITDPFRPFFYVLQKLLFLSSIMQITLIRK